MPRQIFTSADIRDLAREQKTTLLYLGTDDILTAEASDTARELGIRIEREDEKKQSPISVSPSARPSFTGPLPPLKQIFGRGVVLEPFGAGLSVPGTNVRLKDVVTAADGSSMAAGYMTLDKGELTWTLTYDEMDIVLEGELVIRRGEMTARGTQGDVIFIPNGSAVTFSTPGFARFIYVTYPANWNEPG